MIKEFVNDEQCLNCFNCSNICPSRAIFVKYDKLGFPVPEVDSSKCINCRKCIQVCPAIDANLKHLYFNEANSIAVGFRNSSSQILSKSTSGGIFSFIAEHIISKGGYVFGAKFDEKFTGVSHGFATNSQELKHFMGAKYVQSKLFDCFKTIRQLLKLNKTVLFTGTPCQVAALNLFIDSPVLKEKLLTIDLICHGVPSPLIFSDFIKYLETKKKAFIKSISFRDKRMGWKGNNVSVTFDSGETIFFQRKNSFVSFFEQSYSIHNACFSCSFSRKNRVGDITIGDFWGLEKIHPEYNDQKGFSIVIMNSDKGKRLLQMINDGGLIFPVNYFDYSQKNLTSPTNMPFKKNVFDEFYVKKGYRKASHRWSLTTRSGRLHNLFLKVERKYFNRTHH